MKQLQQPLIGPDLFQGCDSLMTETRIGFVDYFPELAIRNGSSNKKTSPFLFCGGNSLTEQEDKAGEK